MASAPSARTPPYKYTPLDTTQLQIRLFKVRTINNELHCDISNHSLIDPPAYRALSYTWGAPTPTFPIFIADKPFHVRQNLYTALRKFGKMCTDFVDAKPEFDPPYFWADQICIDQADVKERNHQVRMMARIFGSADVVTIWLAETNVFRDREIPAPPTHPDVNVEETPITLNDIAELLQDPYFSRVWIVQEMILSRNRDIYVPGNAIVAFDTIGNACWSQHDELKALGVDESTLMLFVNVLYSVYKKDRLAKWFLQFSKQRCADPRDKVYGFLGLDRAIENRLVVDYSKSVEEVFVDAAMYVRGSFLRTAISRMAWSMTLCEPVEYYTMLCDLAEEMGILGVRREGLKHMLKAVWRLDDDEFVLDEKYRPDYPPVTAMGIEIGAASDGNVSNSLGESEMADRWWYECEGERREFSCIASKTVKGKQEETEI